MHSIKLEWILNICFTKTVEISIPATNNAEVAINKNCVLTAVHSLSLSLLFSHLMLATTLVSTQR